MEPSNRRAPEATIGGLIAAVFALGVTLLVSLVLPPPWGLIPVLFAVGIAAFAAAFLAISLTRNPPQGQGEPRR